MKTNVTHCPHCGTKLNVHVCTTEGAECRPGDATICAYCGEFSVYGENLDLHKPSASDAERLAKDPCASQTQKMIKGLIFRRKQRNN